MIKIEDTLVYPLLKSSHLKKPIIQNSEKICYHYSKKVREETEFIKNLAPKTWIYLNNKEYFEKK